MKRVAIDFDDVIADTVPLVLESLNMRQPAGMHEWTKRDITHWGISEITGFSDNTVKKAFLDLPFTMLRPISNAVYNLVWLENHGWEIVVLTANPRTDEIKLWLEKYGLFHLRVRHSRTKVGYCLDNDIPFLVDDKPSLHDYAIMQPDRMEWLTLIQFAQPWNGNHEPRVDNWDDLVLLLEELGEASEPKEEVVVNSNGAKQTDIGARFDLLPAKALKEVAVVLKRGAEKYGEENWRGLSVPEIHNHTLGHAVAFNQSNSLEDLAHTACRALMALEIYLSDEPQPVKSRAFDDYERCMEA